MLVSRKVVLYWMYVGLIMIFIQIILGGITRLTGSGLSITKWEIVTGSIPPLNKEQWVHEFGRYKETPQYKRINEGMSLSDFKFIYFWEYIHRLWARWMGFIFVIPFVVFLYRGWITREIVRNLVLVVFLAGLAGLFGWIMVQSGLQERPWVNAYKLSLHLGIALLVYITLLWSALRVRFDRKVMGSSGGSLIWVGLMMCIIQILIGGVVSGIKGALVYPTWPDMGGEFFPAILWDIDHWNVANFVDYENSSFLPALAQSLHRVTGYILAVISFLIVVRVRREDEDYPVRVVGLILGASICFQVFLGIMVLIRSIGRIPVGYGVMHQGMAIIILSCFVSLFYFNRYNSLGKKKE